MAKRKVKRYWLYGNTSAGYTVKKTKEKKCPWISQVWNGGEIVRTDCHDTKKDAVKYVKFRKEGRPKKLYPKRGKWKNR